MNYKIVSKYIKDISFRIPNAKTYYLLEKNIKNYRVKIDVKSKKINESVLEIDTNLYFDPKITEPKGTENFKISLIFSSLINFDGKVDDSKLEKIILIEIPNAIYPDLKKITSFIFENSGFKDVQISKEVDFERLYRMRKVQ